MPVRVQEVAEHASVSPGTVSNYLNHPHKVARSTAVRIQRAIDELGYVTNFAARTTRTGYSKTIAALFIELSSPSNYDLREAAEERADKGGYPMIVASSSGSPDRFKSYLDLFASLRVNGILLAPVDNAEARIRALQLAGVSVVSIGVPQDPTLCSSVSPDDFEGGRLAVDHLIDVGRRRIAFVGDDSPLLDRRLNGARYAAKERGLDLEVIHVPDRSMHSGQMCAQGIVGRNASDRPDALFAANDVLALGILHGFVRDGSLRVPDDIAIVGYDDIEFAEEAVVPLTSIRMAARTLGRTSVEVLLSEIEQRREGVTDIDFARISLTPSLVARKTTQA